MALARRGREVAATLPLVVLPAVLKEVGTRPVRAATEVAVPLVGLLAQTATAPVPTHAKVAAALTTTA